MRKELLIAVVIGLFFGIIIGFGIWRANNAINNDQISTEATPTDIQNESLENADVQTEIPTQNDGLVISSPQNYDVIASSSVTVKGLSSPNTKIVISAENKDYLIEATSNGDFEASIDLIDGLNQIILSEANLSIQEPTILKVIYSKDFNQ